MSEELAKFTWVQTHYELAKYLKDKQQNQKDLIQLLANSGVDAGLFDMDPQGNKFDLEEIDPFSFFRFIYKYGPSKRLQILQNIAKKLNLHYPEDELGIPSAQAMKVMLFPYRYGRNNNEIDKLWKLFIDAVNNEIKPDVFESVLSNYGVGLINLTEGLFCIDPNRYLPINAPVKAWLKNIHGIQTKFGSLTEYLQILDDVRKVTQTPFYQLSHDAYEWNENHNQIKKTWDQLVEDYINYLNTHQLDQEKYKWVAIKHFQDQFDLDAPNFEESLKSAVAKSTNLVYQNARAYILKAANYFPDETRQIFRNLYDESQPLETRYTSFIEATKALEQGVSEKYGKPRKYSQDERSVGFFLTMRYPDRYPLYKAETYSYLIKILNIDEEMPAGKKLFHYLELSQELINLYRNWSNLETIIRDNLTDDCYSGDQTQIIFQDILWVNKRFLNTSQYWLFQCNPTIFNLKQALNDEIPLNWRVTAHRDKIKTGDYVVLWQTAENRGVYAICEITSDVYEGENGEEGRKYFLSQNEQSDEVYQQVDLRVQNNLADSPITEDLIKNHPDLTELKIGRQGTNFPISKEQFEAIMHYVNDREVNSRWVRLQKTVHKINSDKATRLFFKAVSPILKKLDLSEGAANLYAAAIDYYIHVTIGGIYLIYVQRNRDNLELCFHIERKELGALQAIYPELEYKKASKHKSLDTLFIIINLEQYEVNLDDFIDRTVEVGKQLAKMFSKSNYRKIFPNAYNPWIFKVANDPQLLEKLMTGKEPEEADITPQPPIVIYPLNTIFYGPPGTGKTYTTIRRAAEIVSGREIPVYEEAKRIFHENLGETIEFITFHQNYSYEDFIQGLRPDVENSQELTFERSDGIFKRLAERALINWQASASRRTKKLPFDQVFKEFFRPITEGDLEEIEIKMKRVSYFVTAISDKSISFRKTSGGTHHTLSISTLRRMYEVESVMNIQGLSTYYTPLLHELLSLGKQTGELETISRKNYVLIIDEINRANISRVFGELITLIEPDKRFGAAFHIPAKLPSGESFSVPANLHIIGTMNTADKSIALLDIALRRRFEFEAMYPLYEIDGAEIADVDILRSINSQIIELKGHDFQIGHSYFMNKNESIEHRMNRKVIPLLMEYFMNDEVEVRRILDRAGLTMEENTWPICVTGTK
jgi:hypothetical protein